MTEHWNIGKKKQINPFEKVEYVVLDTMNNGEKIEARVNQAKHEPIAVCYNNTWHLAFKLETLDFLTMIKWYTPDSGNFYYKHSSIEFKIVDKMLILNKWK